MAMKLALASLVGAAAALGACTAYDPYNGTAPLAAAPAYGVDAVARPGGCFYARDIRNHTVLDDHTLLINVADRDVYRVEMSGACLAGATSSDPIITRQPPGSTTVCRPIDLDISIAIGGGMRSPCIVSDIVRLTPEEVAALPPKLRP
jgi:hypothetical protein